MWLDIASPQTSERDKDNKSLTSLLASLNLTFHLLFVFSGSVRKQLLTHFQTTCCQLFVLPLVKTSLLFMLPPCGCHILQRQRLGEFLMFENVSVSPDAFQENTKNFQSRWSIPDL